MKFTHNKQRALDGLHTISNEQICLRLWEADFETDEQMNEAIQFILSKLNS